MSKSLSDSLPMILVRPVLPTELAELAEWEVDNATGATWGIGDLSEEFHHPHSHFFVAAEGAQLRGYMVARRMPDGYELLNILVPEQHRRTGVARRLMDALHELSGIEAVYLEVRASNVPAQALYAAYGYEQTGLRARYYRDGEDAVLMSREN